MLFNLLTSFYIPQHLKFGKFKFVFGTTRLEATNKSVITQVNNNQYAFDRGPNKEVKTLL